MPDMCKTPPSQYFKLNSWVRENRTLLGTEKFDKIYETLHKCLNLIVCNHFISIKNMQTYLINKGLCEPGEEYHELLVRMIDLYYNMDFFVNLKYDENTDIVTMLPPFFATQEQIKSGRYAPPPVYLFCIKNPKRYGVDPDDLKN